MTPQELIKALREKPSVYNRKLLDEAANTIERLETEKNNRTTETPTEISQLIKSLRDMAEVMQSLGDLPKTAILREAAEKLNEQDYTIIGIMHSIDKWLEGDELNQDEVNRAATMREKTLRIIEGLESDLSLSRNATLPPVTVGQKVYQTDGVRICELTVRKVIYETESVAFDEEAIGKSIFLSAEQAGKKISAALAKKKHTYEEFKADMGPAFMEISEHDRLAIYAAYLNDDAEDRE